MLCSNVNCNVRQKKKFSVSEVKTVSIHTHLDLKICFQISSKYGYFYELV